MPQITLPFPDLYDHHDVILRAECNKLASKFLDSWPTNLNFINHAILFGAKSSGKTTLLTNWLYNNNGYLISNLKSFLENHQQFLSYDCFAIENLEIYIKCESEFFYLMNLLSEKNLLISTNNKNYHQYFLLTDLTSRLNSAILLEINDIDQEMARQLIIKLCAYKQLIITNEIIEYITDNLSLNYENIIKFIQQIDDFAKTNKKNITLTLIKKFIF